jgi:DNA-binding CsgD family transcriptional regulator
MMLDPPARAWLDEQLGHNTLCVLWCAPFGACGAVWAASRAHLARGAAVLAARAVATDRGRPYATLQRLLAGWVAGEPRAAVQRACRGLWRLRLLVPELGEADGPLEPTGIQADLTTLVRRLAEGGPVWLLVDALHRADEDSVAMLAAVAAGAGALPVGVCGTVDVAAAVPAGARVHRVTVPDALAVPDAAELQGRVRERLGRLERAPRQALETLSVARWPVDLDDLHAALPGEVELDACLDALELAGWVRSEVRGAAVLLVACAPRWLDAVRDQLSPRRRQILHAAWLAVPLSPAARLHHTLGAGVRADDGAVARLHEAGAAELRAARHEEAAALLELAHDLARRRGGVTAALLEDLGTARRYKLDFEGCRQAWDAALEARPTPSGIARLRRALAMLDWDLGDQDAALAQVQAGWQALEGRSGPDVEALARTELIFLDRRLRHEELEDAARRLLAVASSPEAISEAQQVLAVVQAYRGDPAASESVARSIEAALRGGDARVLARARHGRNMVLLGTGRPREVRDLTEAEGDSSFYARFANLLAATLLADLEYFEEVVGAFPEVTTNAFMVELARGLLRGEGSPDQLPVAAWDERAEVMIAYLKAAMHELHDRYEASLATFEAVGMLTPAELRGPFHLYSARILGVASARVGRAAEARALADWLDARPEPFAAEAGAWVRGVIEGDAAALVKVADKLALRGLARMEATCRLDAVRCPSPPKDPQAQLRRAWEAVIHLGCDPELARLRQAFVALGVRPPATPRRGPTEGPLSAREQEVAALVAEGLSNKEVAARLYVSPATVATHLKRIYKRLGVHSRAGLTRWVVESPPEGLPEEG